MASSTPVKRGLLISLTVVLFLSFGSLFATLAAGWSPRLGLDLAGGLSVVYVPAHPTTQANLVEATQILTARVNGLGVSGAQVNLQNQNIVVSVPGVSNAQQILDEIGQTAQLFVRPVYCFANDPVAKAKAVKNALLPHCNRAYATTPANINVVQDPNSVQGYRVNNIPADPAFNNILSTPAALDDPKQFVLLPVVAGGGATGRELLGPAALLGTDIAKATAGQLSSGQWVVTATLTSAGSPLWDRITQAYFHAYLAIELDGKIQSSPLTAPQSATWSSFGGIVQISGGFSQEQAKALALVIQFGALPVRLIPQTSQTVSPTLGHSALIAGLGAGLVGLLLVLLYTIVYYRALGLVIVLGLGVTGALLWAIISALGHTAIAPSFDLAGVTGLIVSIGITVDSYIVYFERLKDETRAGRTVRTSVDRGFRSAWRTVVAADTVSLLAAVLLYMIAVGSVRGFAFFLGLSTLLDVIVTWYFTRPLVMLLGRRSGQVSTSALSIAAGLGAGVVAGE